MMRMRGLDEATGKNFWRVLDRSSTQDQSNPSPQFGSSSIMVLTHGAEILEHEPIIHSRSQLATTSCEHVAGWLRTRTALALT